MTLSADLATLTAAMQAVPSFVGADSATLASVIAPLQACQADVTALIAESEAVLAPATTVGALTPGAPGAQNAAALQAQAAAMQNLAALYVMDATMARMATNLAADGQSGTPLVTATDLTRVAVAAFGDAGQWPVIAKANGLTDPILQAVQTIRIPLPAAQSPDGLIST